MLTALAYVGVMALVVGVLFALTVLVFGRSESLPPIPVGMTPTSLPAEGVTGDDVRGLRFGMVVRGYRMSEVDWALGRLGAEIDELRARLAVTDGGGDCPGDPGARDDAGVTPAG